jgi:hypothetical protein
MLNKPIILSLSKYNGELKSQHEITLFCENLENYIDDTNNMSIFLNNERINEIIFNEKINEINIILPKKEKPEIVKLMVVVNDDIKSNIEFFNYLPKIFLISSNSVDGNQGGIVILNIDINFSLNYSKIQVYFDETLCKNISIRTNVIHVYYSKYSKSFSTNVSVLIDGIKCINTINILFNVLEDNNAKEKKEEEKVLVLTNENENADMLSELSDYKSEFSYNDNENDNENDNDNDNNTDIYIKANDKYKEAEKKLNYTKKKYLESCKVFSKAANTIYYLNLKKNTHIYATEKISNPDYAEDIVKDISKPDYAEAIINKVKEIVKLPKPEYAEIIVNLVEGIVKLVELSNVEKPEYATAEYATAEYAKAEYAKAEYATAEYSKPKYVKPKYVKPKYAKPKYLKARFTSIKEVVKPKEEDRKQKEEEDRKEKEEEDRKQKEEEDRKQKEEEDRKQKEDAEEKVKQNILKQEQYRLLLLQQHQQKLLQQQQQHKNLMKKNILKLKFF